MNQLSSRPVSDLVKEIDHVAVKVCINQRDLVEYAEYDAENSTLIDIAISEALQSISKKMFLKEMTMLLIMNTAA